MHHIESFKGFQKANVDLLQPFVLLIGRNGSGKSNLIEAVEVLSHLAQGTPLGDFGDILVEGAEFKVRGGLAGCAPIGHSGFTLGFSANAVTGGGRSVPVNYSIQVDTSGVPRVETEILECTGLHGHRARSVFQSVHDDEASRSGSIRFRYDNFAPGRNKPQRLARADRSILSQFASLVGGQEGKKGAEAVTLAESLQNHLRASFVFDPAPRAMRSYCRTGDVQLRKDGSNLSSVLLSLQRAQREPMKYTRESFEFAHRGVDPWPLDRILETLRKLPEEPIVGLEFVVTSLGDALVTAQFGGTAGAVDARLLSDGTLRALACLTAVETAPRHGRVVIEEVDNGLHPSRVTDLISHLTRVARKRGLSLVCTTHNPVVLDSLDADSAKAVVLCHRDTTTGAGRLTRLADLPFSDEVLGGGHLGDLVTRGIVEQYLSPDLPERRKAAMKAWLETLP